jgi:hypothetical protein
MVVEQVYAVCISSQDQEVVGTGGNGDGYRPAPAFFSNVMSARLLNGLTETAIGEAILSRLDL